MGRTTTRRHTGTRRGTRMRRGGGRARGSLALGRRNSARIARRIRKRTGTRTKTKTKTVYKKITDSNGPVSRSHMVIPMKLPKFGLGKFKQLTAPQFYIYNQTLRLDVGVGLQGVTGVLANGTNTSIPSLYAITDLTNIMALAANLRGGNVENDKTQRVYMDSAKFELMITNQSNDVVNISIFDISARRDLTDSNYENPALAWVTGTTTDMGETTWNVVGSTPFQCPAFTNLYRIDKVFSVELHTGGHHVHNVAAYPKCMFNDVLLQENSAGLGFKEWTKFVMVVVHGFPINDSVTHSQISTASCGIDFVWKKQYEFHVVERSTTQITYGDNLPGSFTVSGEFINDAVGALANQIIA
nr:MAG: capsid protein [Cressdnaviricota sp.]